MKSYINLIRELDRTFTLPQFASTRVMGQHETIGSGKFGIKDIFGMLLDGGVLADSATISLHNNRSYSLTTAQGSLTLQVSASDEFMPNFVVEIKPTVDCQLTVNKAVNGVSTPLKYSTDGGNTMEAGKIYQVVCCGGCWTLGEFIAPPSFLVLTYFEQKESGIFSSIYGGDSPYMSAYLGNETVNFSGIGDIITGKFSSSGGNWVRLFEFSTPDILTIDFFISGNAPQDWIGFSITGSVYGIAGFNNQLAVGFGWDEYPTVTTYNGWYKHYSTAFIMNDNIGSKGHIAFVFNKTNSTTHCYVNGDLAYIRTEYAIADNFYITFAHGNLNGQIANVAQLAVRSGDYSINNGQNFPVPTERYYS